jgi:glutamate--cysteine ligase
LNSKLPLFPNPFCFVGLEKESIRVNKQGLWSLKQHPRALGKTLTHPYITTDYSESQLEFVTHRHSQKEPLLAELRNLHHGVFHTLSHLEQPELLWCFSIPSLAQGQSAHREIPIAHYGNTHRGNMKHIYRQGLSYRYGSQMQMISGVHYNFSFTNPFWDYYFSTVKQKSTWNQNDINQAYLHIARNYLRFGWVISYLFGASAILCKTILGARDPSNYYLKHTGNDAFYAPFGTSLRNSELGYQNKPEITPFISYNTLDDYLKNLQKAILTPQPDFLKLGLYRQKNKKQYRIQLNTHHLQIENEYYSPIRLKPKRGPSTTPPAVMLYQSGIEYLEIRNIDINPYDPIGITQEQCTLMELFLLFCLMEDSPPILEAEHRKITHNHNKVCLLGRKNNVTLYHHTDLNPLLLQEWALLIFQKLIPWAEHLNHSTHSTLYTQIHARYEKQLHHPDLLLSAQLLQDYFKNKTQNAAQTWHHFGLSHAKTHQQHWLDSPLPADIKDFFEAQAQASHTQEQQEAQAPEQTNINFETFLEQYYAKISELK